MGESQCPTCHHVVTGFEKEDFAAMKQQFREECAELLEAAYAECETLNLLHGAARIRAMQ